MRCFCGLKIVPRLMSNSPQCNYWYESQVYLFKIPLCANKHITLTYIHPISCKGISMTFTNISHILLKHASNISSSFCILFQDIKVYIFLMLFFFFGQYNSCVPFNCFSFELYCVWDLEYHILLRELFPTPLSFIYDILFSVFVSLVNSI